MQPDKRRDTEPGDCRPASEPSPRFPRVLELPGSCQSLGEVLPALLEEIRRGLH